RGSVAPGPGAWYATGGARRARRAKRAGRPTGRAVRPRGLRAARPPPRPRRSMDLCGLASRLGATLFFVLLNAFFVAAEFALVKVREGRIEELARAGRPAGARRAPQPRAPRPGLVG